MKKIKKHTDWSSASDVGPMQINNVMGTSVTNHNSFKTALINQYGHNDVITQCFSNYGF